MHPTLSVRPQELLDLSRQQRNLLLMRPLLDLDVHRLRLEDSPQATPLNVDTTYLALSVLDDMMEGLMTSSGRTETHVVQRLVHVIDAMSPGLDMTHRTTVATAVFAALVNKKNGYKAFESSYFDAASSTWRPFQFKLVEMEQDVHDDYYYRPTREGYQVYLGMLDLDIEDAQEMDEKMLQRLIDRGRFDAALDVARQARVHALEHRDMLRQRLTNALRAPGTIRWSNDLGPKVQAATTFVRERRSQAEVSWGLVSDQLRVVDDEAVRQNLVRLRESLDKATEVRLRLVNELLKAPDEFTQAQASVFRARRPSGLPNLENDLLPRLLDLPLNVLADGADTVLAAMLPPRSVKIADVRTWFDQFVDRRVRPVMPEEKVVDMTPLPVHPENFPKELVGEVMLWIGQRFANGASLDTQTLLDLAASEGMPAYKLRCVAMTLLRCFAGVPPGGQQQPESPFPHVSTSFDTTAWFDHPIAAGTNLRFTSPVPGTVQPSQEVSR